MSNPSPSRARAPRGTGSISKIDRTTKVAEIRITTDGRRSKRQVTKRAGESVAEFRARAEQIRKEMIGKRDTATAKAGEVPTVAEYATDVWLPTRAATGTKPSTLATDESVLRLYVIPCVGDVRLDALKPAHITRMDAKLYNGWTETDDDGTEKHIRPKSEGTRRAARRTLRTLVRDAEASEEWPGMRTAADLFHSRKAPFRVATEAEKAAKHERTKRRALTADQLTTVVRNARDDYRWGTLIHLLAATGMRRGEVRGLAWDDVDLDAGEIRVRRNATGDHHTFRLDAPKTKRGNRKIPIGPTLVAELRRWRTVTRAEPGAFTTHRYLAEDLRLVFVDPVGRPITTGQLRGAVERASRGLGWLVSPHDLRHTFGSHLLDRGRAITEVSRLMGHATPLITMEVYAHDVDPDSRGSADVMEAVIGL